MKFERSQSARHGTRSQLARLGGVCWLSLFILGGLHNTVGAEDEAKDKKDPRITLERIFATGDLKAASFGDYQWRQNGPGYIRWKKAGEGRSGRDLVWHDPETDETQVMVQARLFIPPGESNPLTVDSHTFSRDESKLLIYTNSKRVWRRRSRGDYWVLDIAARELKQLGGDAPPSTLMFATFSPDSTKVCFVYDNNLFVQNVADLEITQLTEDGWEDLINGTFDWVYEEELGLRKGFRWSPDSQSIAYWQVNREGVRTFFLINNTDGLYSRVIPIPYPKVGEENSSVFVGVVSAAGGPTTWLDVPGDSRNHYIARMDWAENSEEIILQQLNRLQNTNRVMIANATSAQTKTILTESDDAWIDNDNPTRWIGEGKAFVWLSERNGFRHAYRVSRSGKKTSLLTKGDFDVISIAKVDEANEVLYFMASPDNPTQRYLYRAPLDGGAVERVTPGDQPGSHRYSVSADGNYAIHTWSTFTSPPVSELIRLPSHEVVRSLEENKKLKDTLEALDRPLSELFRIDIGDGVLLDGWMLKPHDFDPGKKYPMLVYVYGEPAGTTVRDQWGGRSQLWHMMLAQQGYLVISLDNRGTPAPRGREWRKLVYRKVGILAPADQAAGIRALMKERPYIDPDRIAVWGWSGGGSMTLNAMFKYPDLYQTGMSVAPVPNQRYYDTIYQERYMGLPKDNVEGFREGSPITYAHQLKGNLLLIHGTGDDNCHYQGTEAVINELIAHNKTFQMMAYPNRSHAISEGKNTSRHLYTLMTQFLKNHTPPGPRDR